MSLTCPSCDNLNPLEARFCARCGTEIALESGPTDFTGSALCDGRYQVEKKLGAGAVGAVYQAMDTQLKRGVALKVLHADMVSHATARTRMIREAQAIAGIDHPNVVRIHELFEEGEHLVLVLELVEGGTLADRLANGALKPEEAKGMIAQLLQGLEAIHAAGIVHRDIKPANVLITKKGLAKLTDFGVAHDQKGRGMTRAGARLGTPEYMAPEQVKGEEVDGRTDLYACGVVLYQLLTGAVPFEGDSDFEVFEGHVRGDVDFSRIPSGTPSALVSAVEIALAKEADERFQSAEGMRQGLDGAKPERSRKPKTVEVEEEEEPPFSIAEESAREETIILPAVVEAYVELMIKSSGKKSLFVAPTSLLWFWAILRRRGLTPKRVAASYRQKGKEATAAFVSQLNLERAWRECNGRNDASEWGRKDLDDEFKTIMSEILDPLDRITNWVGVSFSIVGILGAFFALMESSFWILLGAIVLMAVIALWGSKRIANQISGSNEKKLIRKLAFRGMSGPQFIAACKDKPGVSTDLRARVERIDKIFHLETWTM